MHLTVSMVAPTGRRAEMGSDPHNSEVRKPGDFHPYYPETNLQGLERVGAQSQSAGLKLAGSLSAWVWKPSLLQPRPGSPVRIGLVRRGAVIRSTSHHRSQPAGSELRWAI